MAGGDDVVVDDDVVATGHRPSKHAARGAEWLHRTSANIDPRFASIRVDRSLQVKLGL